MFDWRGTRIKEGSTVVYPGRFDKSMWMNEGVVVFIDYERNVIGVRRTKSTGYPGRRLHHEHTNQVRYPSKDRLTVIGE